MSNIKIIRASEGNLKNISLEIPKNKLVVFTGLSGSGKSTLLVDVLYNECQRQYLEAMSFQGIHKPKVEHIRGVSPAIIISQTDVNRNPRSTVGTLTDIYTDLRMIFEKLGLRKCPYCEKTISSAECKEETEKIGNDFHVYMYCSECGKRMNKITRTYFSFNTREGACPTCEGLGKIHVINKNNVIDEKLSLENGAVNYWEQKYGEYQTSVLYAAFKHYGIHFEPNTSIENFSKIQKSILYDGVDNDTLKNAFPQTKIPKTVASGKFEGVFPILWRRLSEKNGDTKQFGQYFDTTPCLNCNGERLCELSRSVTVNGIRLPEITFYSLDKLYIWIKEVGATLSQEYYDLVRAYLLDIETKLKRFINVGLGYLSLNRQTVTLSGGELQRMRIAAILDSDLSGIIYILDEPTIGLHPKDTAGLITILQKLRDLENTVLVIEHDLDIMKAADYIVDIGPGSGKHGGEVVATGSIEQIKQHSFSATGDYLRNTHPGKSVFRKGTGSTISIKNADKFNLKNINVDIPTGCLVTITGPSGSGKSTLIFEVLAKGNSQAKHTKIIGLDQFSKVVEIEQAAITKMKRSNVATYSEVYTEIRNIFAKTDDARKAKLTAKHFSFNTTGGRCENCEGLGYVDSNMLFFKNIEVTCPICNGNQFNNDVLSVTFDGLSIKDVLKLSVDEAAHFFNKNGNVKKTLKLLQNVGLGYLELGQTITTLSGGEGQRLKLAKELIGGNLDKTSLYLLDEPTMGLHPKDVEHFLVLINSLVEAGNSVVVVEHNQQIINNSDWIIDLGPEGGEKGGDVIFAGTPKDLAKVGNSVTAKYL